MKKKDLSKAMSLMGSKGGKKSSAKLTPEQRSERAKNAASARWKSKEKPEPK